MMRFGIDHQNILQTELLFQLRKKGRSCAHTGGARFFIRNADDEQTAFRDVFLHRFLCPPFGTHKKLLSLFRKVKIGRENHKICSQFCLA